MQASWCESVERVKGCFYADGNTGVRVVGLRRKSRAPAQLKASWTARGAPPKPGLAGAVLAGQVKRPRCGSDVAAMLLEPARAVAAGRLESPWPVPFG